MSLPSWSARGLLVSSLAISSREYGELTANIMIWNIVSQLGHSVNNDTDRDSKNWTELDSHDKYGWFGDGCGESCSIQSQYRASALEKKSFGCDLHFHQSDGRTSRGRAWCDPFGAC